MVLEATVVLLDNSEYGRNEDLAPSRWEAQMEALQLIVDAKLQSNQESGVGLILAGGKQVQLLMTPSNDQNQIIGSCERTRLFGVIHFTVALQQASLALKHRINKKQQQRITAFVASPIEEDDDTLVSIAKKMKKNNISVDIINFGEQNEDHLRKIKLFHDTVQKANSSIYVNITPGTQSVFDFLFATISSQGQGNDQVQGPAQPGQPQVGGNQFAEYGGVNPEVDPELAMAIKLSLEEDKRIHEEAQKQQQQQQQPPQQQEQQQQEPMAVEAPAQQYDQLMEEEDDEEALLEKARLLSLQDEIEEQAKLVQAQKQQQQQQAQQPQQQQAQKNVFEDADFVQSLLESVDVNMEDEEIKKLLSKKKDDEKDPK